MDQREHALRAAEVLEPELAEVAQTGAGREAIGAERGGAADSRTCRRDRPP
jgi:hypothetical protein